MKRECVSAALFSSGDGRPRVHELGDVFESDRRFDERRSELLRHPVDQERRRKGLRDAPGEPAAAKRMEEQKRQDAVGGDEPPAPVENTQPIGIPVPGHAQVAPFFADSRRSSGKIRGDRLGMDASEEDVSLGAKRNDPGPSRVENVSQHGAGGSVHRVGENGQAGRPDRLEVDECGEAFPIRT